MRGDRAFARGDLEEALAEYRLALRQGARDGASYARVAHTYAALGQVDEAGDHYRQAVEQDPGLADQAAADMVFLARRAEGRSDVFGMATAFQAALDFRPGIAVAELALPLARHFSETGEFGRALPFYLKALNSVPADSLPPRDLLYETGLAYDEVGDCSRAVIFYERYRNRLPRWRRDEVDWRYGNCSFQLSRTALEEANLDESLRHLETILRIGEPRNLLSLAYFQKGEILSARGECEAAIEAFSEVYGADVSGAAPHVLRAQERIDEIRFGRPFLEGFRDPSAGPVPCTGSTLIPDTLNAPQLG
jgi:tetratricopeptide (TPR) repeat protein